MRRTHTRHMDGDVGFQIAPMIDVVFVIMLFFMVQAGDRQVEKELKMTLPGSEQSTEMEDTPMEENVSVSVDGEFTHNDEPVTAKELAINFKRLSDQAKAENPVKPTPVVVTIVAEPDTKWEKVVEVMNAMNFAGITNVTFSVPEDY
jgi:biopolymer transport protein ExbD